MIDPKTVERIRAAALDLGFDVVETGAVELEEDARRLRQWVDDGCAGEMGYMTANLDRRADPAGGYPGVRGVVAVAMFHDPGEKEEATPGPGSSKGFFARYARGRDYHRVMEPRLKRLRRAVIDIGGKGTEAWWAVDHAPVMDRALARSAGLGFVGKSTSLIRPGAGSYFLLGEVLTTLALPSGAPRAGSCGTCEACIDVCPTDAITAPYRVDARRCISYLTIELKGPIPEELRPAIGTMVFGCDLCQEVCPWNRFARPASDEDLRPREVAVDPDLVTLADMTREEWDGAFRGPAVRRAGYEGFLRNVAVALGNSGHPGAREALLRLESRGLPLVGEHARWAIDRIDGLHPDY
ncbi:MAG: tRNA epoxyqueuosine(34) reductase QueG [Planctomycetota bacterium]|jgi:epoxyqueuosine reductase